MNLYSYAKTENIEAAVMARIVRARTMRARLATAFHGLLVLGAVFAFMPAFQFMVTQATDSGFLQYSSLITTDWSNLAGSWQAFALSLAESAPIIELVMTLSIVAIFIYSMKKIFENAASLRRPTLYAYQTTA